MDRFTEAYIGAMLWAELDDNERPLDENYSLWDIDKVSMGEIKEDCKAFQEDHWDDISDDLDQAGHDFYLTRNGHGCGFWDGDWPEDVGRRLTESSKVYGTQGLWVGDDGVLYTHG